MTDKSPINEVSDKTKSIRPLTGGQKFLFGMICWGVQTRSQVESFRKNGFDQKYFDAKKAVRNGMIFYSIRITAFIVFLLVKYFRQ